MGQAVGAIELSSIGVGYRVLDEMPRRVYVHWILRAIARTLQSITLPYAYGRH